MSLTFNELNATTDDYFALEDGKAVDNYFQTSFLLNYLLKQQKGLWKRPAGGRNIKVPIEFDENQSGFYERGDTINSDDREIINAALFPWKHAFGNATILRIDDLENSGPEAKVDLIMSKVSNAQKSITKTLAGSIYDNPGGSSSRLTGLRALTSETATLKYGDIAEDDLVSDDGEKVWEGITDTTAEAISLAVIRDLATSAHVRDGVGGDPDFMPMTKILYNAVKDLLQIQQRFVSQEDIAKAGFKGLEFEGMGLYPDDFCPSGHAFALNSKHLGFAVHKRGMFERTKWRFIEGRADDKTMKIYFDGNMITNLRKAHAAHSGLTI